MTQQEKLILHQSSTKPGRMGETSPNHLPPDEGNQ